jgi:hypothetical protein
MRRDQGRPRDTDRRSQAIRKFFNVGLRVAATTQEPLAEFVRYGVIQLRFTQRPANMNDPLQTVALNQGAPGKLASPHGMQAIFAKYCDSHARRTERATKVEASAEIKLAHQHVTDFIPWIAQIATRARPRNARTLNRIPTASKFDFGLRKKLRITQRG